MADLTTEGYNVVRTQNHFYEMVARGLLPNTKHNIYFDGEDIGAITKQYGKDFGEDLVSTSNGILVFGMLAQYEFPRDQNFELPEQQTISFQTNMFGPGTAPRETRVVVNYRFIEIKNAAETSYAQFRMPLNLVLTPGPVRTLYPIE